MGSVTNFPFGLSSFGVTLPAAAGFVPMNGKRQWWVQGNTGSDSNDGSSPDQALKTMARAFALIGSGDVIHFNGNIREQISTPVGVFDVTIIGEATRPRNADAHTGNNGYSAATWKAPAAPTAATPLLTVLQQGWRFVNFLVNPPADAAGIQLFRNGGAGDLERDASHASFYNMRFDGGQDAIEQSGGCAFVAIIECAFRGHTGKAVKDTAGAGIGTLLGWEISNCRFSDNANHVVAALSGSVVRHNSFGKFTTLSLDLSNGPVADVVFGNSFFGTYSVVGGYKKAQATDEWAGNYNAGAASGVTTVVPA